MTDLEDAVARILANAGIGPQENGDVPPGTLSESRVDWSTFFNRDRAEDDWLIEPLIARGRGHALYAPAKAGKSLLVASVLVPAALGRPTLRHRAGHPVRTLYLDYEMAEDDVEQRLSEMGVGPEDADALETLAYMLFPAIAPLDTPAGGETVLQLAQEHRADVVVIDTMARAVQGGENDSDTYRAYERWTGRLLKADGIAVIRTDHAGKDVEKGQRGSSGKNDDVDVVWRLTPKDQSRFTLVATHKRIKWVPATVDLALREDPLRFEPTADVWPAGTAAAAVVLDRLGVPAEAGREKARQAMKAAGETVGTEVLAAAIRYRKATVPDLSAGAKTCPDRAADRSDEPPADRVGGHHPNTPPDLPGQFGGQVWTGSRSDSGQLSISIDGQVAHADHETSTSLVLGSQAPWLAEPDAVPGARDE